MIIVRPKERFEKYTCQPLRETFFSFLYIIHKRLGQHVRPRDNLDIASPAGPKSGFDFFFFHCLCLIKIKASLLLFFFVFLIKTKSNARTVALDGETMYVYISLKSRITSAAICRRVLHKYDESVKPQESGIYFVWSVSLDATAAAHMALCKRRARRMSYLLLIERVVLTCATR